MVLDLWDTYKYNSRVWAGFNLLRIWPNDLAFINIRSASREQVLSSRLVQWKSTNISEESIAYIFRGEERDKHETSKKPTFQEIVRHLVTGLMG
jgi:hypothetical protein